jgi:hypothetical protein
MYITPYFGAERRRDMEAHAEVSRIARANRRRRPVWAWLRRGRRLALQPSLATALPEPGLAAAGPLPALAPTPPQPDPTPTRPLPALSGAATGHQASPAA